MGFGKVAVVGLGYIGLPTAAVLATSGTNVIGIDVSQLTVDAVNGAKVPFVEPDLGEVLARAVRDRKLRATTRPEPADAFILAVPTPFTAEHQPDLSFIKAAAESIAPVLTGSELIVLESTSPPGATKQLSEWILALRPDLTGSGADAHSIDFAYCPERVLPGNVLFELANNDRVLGGLTPQAATRAQDLYALFCTGSLMLTDATTAEMTKLVENAYRDVNIAFANELSVIADRVGVDVWELISLANHHPRVNILKPGPGVGGHCIAVDPWFIVDTAPKQAKLIRSARKVNDRKPKWVVNRIVEVADAIAPPTIAVLGLAFKANIDDLRGSPARKIVARLADKLPSTRILVVEPHVLSLPSELEERSNVSLATVDELAGVPLAVELVAHAQFKGIDDLLDPGARLVTFARPSVQV